MRDKVYNFEELESRGFRNHPGFAFHDPSNAQESSNYVQQHRQTVEKNDHLSHETLDDFLRDSMAKHQKIETSCINECNSKLLPHDQSTQPAPWIQISSSQGKFVSGKKVQPNSNSKIGKKSEEKQIKKIKEFEKARQDEIKPSGEDHSDVFQDSEISTEATSISLERCDLQGESNPKLNKQKVKNKKTATKHFIEEWDSNADSESIEKQRKINTKTKKKQFEERR